MNLKDLQIKFLKSANYIITVLKFSVHFSQQNSIRNNKRVSLKVLRTEHNVTHLNL